MKSDCDIVIVGGGPAGLTTAIAMATLEPDVRARMLVLEAEAYPRDKYCAGAIGGRGDRILAKLESVPAVPSVTIDGLSLRVGAGEVVARPGRIGRVVRRIEFDHELARIARRRGVSIEEGARVLEVERLGDRAVVRTAKGDVTAKIVVGADGVGSAVRRAMGLSKGRLRAQVLEVDTDPVPGDRDRGILHFDASDRTLPGYTWDFPTTVGGEGLVCRGIYHLRVGDESVDLTAKLGARLAERGLDLATCKNKRFAERGYEPDGEVVRGPLLLVGEAAGIDPVTGEGIAQAIEYGELAGRFLARERDGAPRSLERWSQVVRRSRLGVDLAVRTRAVAAFYGARRPGVEAFALECPNVLYIGCQHFAALPIDRARASDVAVRAGWRLLRSGLARAARRAQVLAT